MQIAALEQISFYISHYDNHATHGSYCTYPTLALSSRHVRLNSSILYPILPAWITAILCSLCYLPSRRRGIPACWSDNHPCTPRSTSSQCCDAIDSMGLLSYGSLQCSHHQLHLLMTVSPSVCKEWADKGWGWQGLMEIPWCGRKDWVCMVGSPGCNKVGEAPLHLPSWVWDIQSGVGMPESFYMLLVYIHLSWISWGSWIQCFDDCYWYSHSLDNTPW